MQRPDQYSVHDAKSSEVAAACLRRHADLLRPRGRDLVLDVGCGTGAVTASVLAPLYPAGRVVGSDVSGNMVQFAERNNPAPNLSYRQLDITGDLPKDLEGHVSVIFCFYVVQRIHDQRKVCENLYRLLQPGGVLLLLFPSQVLSYLLYRALLSRQDYQHLQQKMSGLIPPFMREEGLVEAYRELLRQANFKEVTAEVTTTTLNMEIDHFKSLFESVDLLMESLEGQERSRYLEEYLQVMLDHGIVTRTGDLISNSYQLVEFTAHK